MNGSAAFDMPAAYCRFALPLWNHETEDLHALHAQQQSIANFQLRHHEFQTMDDLLIRSRDFVNSQHFYEVGARRACELELPGPAGAAQAPAGEQPAPRPQGAQLHVQAQHDEEGRGLRAHPHQPPHQRALRLAARRRRGLLRGHLRCSSLSGSLTPESLLPQPTPSFSVLSCGTPNAYALGFSEGGLFDLLLQLRTLRDRRSPSTAGTAGTAGKEGEAPHKMGLLDRHRTLGIAIRERFDLSTSQAIAILATAFIHDVGAARRSDAQLRTLLRSCATRFLDEAAFVQWRAHGYPVGAARRGER